MKAHSTPIPALGKVALTAAGQPRQRQPGAGRPLAGRPCRLNARVSEACQTQLVAIQRKMGFKTLVQAIEHAVSVAFERR